MRLVYGERGALLYCGDSRNLSELADGSVALIVTSPPYFNARSYASWPTYEAYLDDMYKVWTECKRVLVDTGRIAINIPPDYGYGAERKHFFLDIGAQMRELFNFWGPICLDKNTTGTSQTAWGSFNSASRPNFRGRFEFLLVASKGDYKRAQLGESDLEADEFTEFSQNLWRFSWGMGRNEYHEAPFPYELPYRAIKMLSYVGETVLDPFAGSFTTIFAARDLRRVGVGVEMHEKYVNRAVDELRLGTYGARLKEESARAGYIQESLLET